MKSIVIFITSMLLMFNLVFGAGSEEVIYADSWGDQGISIDNQSSGNIVVNFPFNHSLSVM